MLNFLLMKIGNSRKLPPSRRDGKAGSLLSSSRVTDGTLLHLRCFFTEHFQEKHILSLKEKVISHYGVYNMFFLSVTEGFSQLSLSMYHMAHTVLGTKDAKMNSMQALISRHSQSVEGMFTVLFSRVDCILKALNLSCWGSKFSCSFTKISPVFQVLLHN